MGAIVSFPPRAASAEWQRYAGLVRELRTRPSLIEDETHLAARKAAYRRFLAAFNGASR
jgi:hypothetical protein